MATRLTLKKDQAYDQFTTSFTVADGTAISKGVILKLTDPMTAQEIGAAESNVPVAGIAFHDKEASDGSTTIAAWTQGVFKGTASGAIAIGDPLEAEAGSRLRKSLINATGAASLAASMALICGTSLETAADGETFLFKLKV